MFHDFTNRPMPKIYIHFHCKAMLETSGALFTNTIQYILCKQKGIHHKCLRPFTILLFKIHPTHTINIILMKGDCNEH